MGMNHVRVYDRLPEADLIVVVENDPSQAAKVRARYDAQVVESVNDLEDVQAVSIAVPNRAHREVAEQCIDRGLDILIEKPLALSVDDANAIVERAEEAGVVLQVGHIERFNPAVTTLEEILEREEVIAIEAHRLGPFNEHLNDESVIFDLMVHDLDVIDHLVGGQVSYIDAIGAVSRSNEIDHAVTHFKFDNDIVGAATASHVTHGKVRELHVTTSEAYITLDYQDQNVNIQRRGHEQTTQLHRRTGYRTETLTETPFVGTREPLLNELEHFIECVRNQETPSVDGQAGLRAVQLATTVVERIGSH